MLPYKEFKEALEKEHNENLLATVGSMRGILKMKGNATLMQGEKLELIMKVTKKLNVTPLQEGKWPKKLNISVSEEGGLEKLISFIDCILRVTVSKSSSKELGFICLFTDGQGTYWFKVSRGFATAINESLSSLEKLIDDVNHSSLSLEQKEKVNAIYRVLNALYE